MNHDITFEVIGNTSPFYMMGESSCYMVTVNNRSYLLNCGSPIPVCGNCRFYKPQESEGNMNEPYGACFAMPPVPNVNEDGVATLRPLVEIDEPPCAFHQMVAQ